MSVRPFSSLDQAAMSWFRSQQRRFCKPGIPRSMQIMKRSSLGLLPCLSGHTLRATSGARRHVAALLSGLLSQIEFGPLLQNARLGTWEPGLSLWLRRGVTRPIREFNFGDFTMYQNRITLIGFLGNDAVTRTANNASFTVLSLATKSSYKDKKTGEYNSHTELKRERWTATVTYVFRENVKNNELAVDPLGLTIVRFRADQAFE